MAFVVVSGLIKLRRVGYRVIEARFRSRFQPLPRAVRNRRSIPLSTHPTLVTLVPSLPMQNRFLASFRLTFSEPLFRLLTARQMISLPSWRRLLRVVIVVPIRLFLMRARRLKMSGRPFKVSPSSRPVCRPSRHLAFVLFLKVRGLGVKVKILWRRLKATILLFRGRFLTFLFVRRVAPLVRRTPVSVSVQRVWRRRPPLTVTVLLIQVQLRR